MLSWVIFPICMSIITVYVLINQKNVGTTVIIDKKQDNFVQMLKIIVLVSKEVHSFNCSVFRVRWTMLNNYREKYYSKDC